MQQRPSCRVAVGAIGASKRGLVIPARGGVAGMTLSAARKAPMSEKSLKKGLGENLGGGPLSLAKLDLSGLRLEAELFLPGEHLSTAKDMSPLAMLQICCHLATNGAALVGRWSALQQDPHLALTVGCSCCVVLCCPQRAQ